MMGRPMYLVEVYANKIITNIQHNCIYYALW